MNNFGGAEGALRALEDLIGRKEPVDTIGSLLAATSSQVNKSPPSVVGSAICIDANVFIRLATMDARAQVIDYLASRHKEPIIVSAQALQEVWNNYLNGVETRAQEIQSRFESLSKAVSDLDSEFASFKDQFDKLIEEFRDEFGHLYNPSMGERVRTFIEMLRKRALFSEVPRKRFEAFAAIRKRTKTPPGFKDEGDGDYFIWLDFLYGLRLSRQKGSLFNRAILVSADRKVDWVKGGVAHPTLSAECAKYVGVALEIWPIKRLVDATRDVSGAG